MSPMQRACSHQCRLRSISQCSIRTPSTNRRHRDGESRLPITAPSMCGASDEMVLLVPNVGSSSQTSTSVGRPATLSSKSALLCILHLPFVVRLEEDVLNEVFAALSQAGEDNLSPQRVLIAIRWLARAWTNSEALAWDDRIVMLKTAFEALLGESRNPEAMEALRAIFERCSTRHGDEMNAEALLWSPDEAELHNTTLSIARRVTDPRSGSSLSLDAATRSSTRDAPTKSLTRTARLRTTVRSRISRSASSVKPSKCSWMSWALGAYGSRGHGA
jgi:hypothetical protein